MRLIKFPHYRLKLTKQFFLRHIRLLEYAFSHLPRIELREIIKEEESLLPVILDDACMPPYHPFIQDHDDLTPLLKIVRHLRPQIVVELGTAHGNTVANICRQSPQTKVFTVNAPAEKQSGKLTTFNLSIEEIGRVYRKYGFNKQVQQIFENTLYLDLSQYFKTPVVDLAIIDACHDKQYVLNDFHKVRPFIKPGGQILLHDTAFSSLPTHLDGSFNACRQLRQEGYDIKHIHETWWGIWTN